MANITQGTMYGISLYGTSTYGYSIPPQYRVDPFIAQSVDYEHVLVSWNEPQGDILAWRLVKNSYGPPTDQDDGEILIDTTTGYPGNYYVDANIQPGKYQYYGFYVLLSFLGNNWVRSGLASCLAVNNYFSGTLVHNLTPSFFLQNVEPSEAFIGDDLYSQFCNVLGWGLDYLRTQYDTYLNINNPWTIPPDDLWNLALELGININPDIHTYTLRKAVYYNAIVNQQRGTLTGINTQLAALTGYEADIQIGNNIMLENDQSYFPDPSFQNWSQYQQYNLNEIVTFGNFYYKCISTANLGNAPTGLNSSNTWWQPFTQHVDTITLANPVTGGFNTWEVVVPGATNGTVAGTLFETDGVENRLNAADNAFNALTMQNTTGATNTMWIRSVARNLSLDYPSVAPNFLPDKYQAIADGIPVPYLLNPWEPNIRYATDSVVEYSGIPYTALRASTDIVPPYSVMRSSSNEWAPISNDQRFRICISGYFTGTSATVITPFIEWYDENGNFITRIFSRGPGTQSSPALPESLIYDSFTFGSGNTISGRITDDTSTTWSVQTGGFTVSPFGNGCAYPTATRSIATVNYGSPNGQAGLTIVTEPNAGQSTGLVFRWSSNSNYWRCDQATLKKNVNGTLTTVATHSTPFAAGDRMIVLLNGSSITVQRNGVTVSTATDSFNSSATNFGIITENS